MAQINYCKNEDGRVADVLITDLSNGDSDFLCQECFVVVCMTVTNARIEAETAGPEDPEAPETPDGDDEPPGEPTPIGEGMGRGRPRRAGTTSPENAEETPAPTAAESG